jgi:SOS regulatory protein LexA
MEKHRRAVEKFFARRGRLPGYAELMEICGFKSKNAAWKLINRLAEAGVVRKGDDGRLSPGSALTGLRLLGVVEAGFPTPSEEHELDSITLDEYLIENREATFLLRVKGDSMIDAGIREGDLVLAERGREAKAGDIVVAAVDGAWTMKRLRKKNGRAVLVAENPDYPDIVPRESLQIEAVVRGVIRKYR